METMVPPAGQMPETGGSGRAWRKGPLAQLLPVLGALLLSGGMLAAWFTGMARASSLIQEPPPAAPAAAQFDIFKSSDPITFTIGPGSDTSNRYIIGVRRNTSTPPTLMSVSDLMPVGITISDVQAIDWNCGISGNSNQISCTYTGQHASFPSIRQSYPPIIISLNIASSVANEVKNTAKLVIDGSSEFDSNELITNVDSVDLRIKKSVSRQFADVGETLNYTIQYFNAGPATAKNVKIVDIIPKSIQILSISSPTTSQTTTSTLRYMMWEIPSFGPNVTNTITMSASPTGDARGKVVTNNVSIRSGNASDWKPDNNTASASFTVSGLEITKTKPPGDGYFFVGEPFTYTIQVKNNSATPVSGVGISDLFDPGLMVLRAKLNGVTSNNCSISGNNLSCSNVNLTANGIATLDAVVRGNSTISQPITVTNQATVRARPSIVRSSNITETGVVTITPAVDLYVTTTDGVTEVTPNQVVTYTVTVQNIGSVTEKKKFVITDTLAENLDFVRFDLGTLKNELKAISPDDLTHVWSFDEELEPNEAISYRITGRVKSNAPVDNSTLHRVVVKSPDDKYDGDDTAEDRNKIVVHPTANFNFNLTSDRKRVEVGEGIHFLITLENKGDTLAPNARVTDVFPSVLDIVDAKTNFGTLNINASTRTMTVDLGYLAIGRKILIAISTKVNSSATTSAVYEHKSVLTYNPNVTIESNTVKFSVIAGGGILPGTGLGPPAHYADARASSPALWLLPFALLLPLVLLGGRWSRIRPT